MAEVISSDLFGFLPPAGYIAVDGTSLTVCEATDKDDTHCVCAMAFVGSMCPGESQREVVQPHADCAHSEMHRHSKEEGSRSLDSTARCRPCNMPMMRMSWSDKKILVQVGERVNLEADCMGKAACITLNGDQLEH